MAKLQEKYKGKKDQLSRQAMAQEQMEMYRKHGTNPSLPACRFWRRCRFSSVCTRF